MTIDLGTLLRSVAAAALLLPSAMAGQAPDTEGASIALTDEATKIGDLRTLFVGDPTVVTLDGIVWSEVDVSTAGGFIWETSIDGIIQETGTIEVSDNTTSLDLPSSIDAGSVVVDKAGATIVTVTITSMDDVELAASASSDEMMAFRPGVSLLPLILILVLAFTTQMVELSLFLGIWLGACLLTGSLSAGFKTTLDEFLVGALADEGHVYVILFSVFLSGMVGIMQKSGGMLGFTNAVSKFAKTPRAGQFACMGVGIVIFFDDYANLLLTGETMRPLLDILGVSREKLSFIVDATAAPIASISPISSWVGFEAGLVQEAVDTLLERNGGEALTIPDKGFAVFLESIRYSYYSLFMIGLIAMLIFTGRDFGPMLLAERRVRVYDRTDGGQGAAHAAMDDKEVRKNDPKEDQPLLMINFLIPIIVWIILVFVILVNSGASGEPGQGFIDKIESGDSYVALLYGSMGAAWITMLFYLLQITVPGTSTLASPAHLSDMLPWSKAENPPRFLMTIHESIESFLFGMARIFLAIVILTLAWGCGSIMTTIGVDRLFSQAITGGSIDYQIIPTLTFVIAFLMGLATGTSWGTMAILYPLVLVPTYEAAAGDTQVFYSTVSAVMGGAVAGDHSSPISDTTVLSSLACDVTLMAHVNTQAPYVLIVVFISILVGYIPAGYGAYPNIVGILLGWVLCGLFTWFVCVPVLSPTGNWDFVTNLAKLGCYRNSKDELDTIAADCVKKAAGDDVAEAAPAEEKKVDEESSNEDPKEENPKTALITEEKSM